MEDKRFAHLKTDPKFRGVPKASRKVKIDKRFQSMFKDKKFKVKYTVDKRGRPVNHTSTEDLKRYYDLSSEEDSSDGEPDKIVKAPVSDELQVKHKTDKAIPDAIKKKLRNLQVDYARGESSLFSESSSDDEESEEEVSEGEVIEHNWGELDNDAEKTEQETHRLAACNMDWDRIRAMDLMVLFNSFLPPGGAVKSVTIYPSEFGKARIKEEELKGPIELVEKRKEQEDETEEGSKYHMEKLRQYQLNRLKYYYAVIIFDSPNSANKIYTECDGMEYESSATKLDLRFIPDDLTFDDDPKDQCDKLPELNKYQPRFFTTTALQQAKVNLTWDETDPDRIELTQRINSGKIEDFTQNDLQNYIAFSDEESAEEESEDEDESDKKNSIDKYKELLQEINNKEEEKKQREVEMEMSWGRGLKDKTEELVNKKMAENEEKTPFEKYLDKRKEKRKERKKMKKGDDSESDDVPSDIDMNDPYFAEEFNNPEFKRTKDRKPKQKDDVEEDTGELELLLLNEDDHKSHFNLKKIQKQEESTSKKKKKRKRETSEDQRDDFEINVQDDRFSALFTSHLYNIDPTSPHYKKTKGMETLINEKINRRNYDGVVVEEKNGKKKNAELSSLVKSVKRKAEALNNKKK